MKTRGQRFRVLPAPYAVCRLAPGAALPSWIGGPFFNVTSTADELSVICRAERVPASIRAERDWRLLQVVGPLPFSAIGLLASLVAPLAAANVSALAVATYDTDYLLVKENRFDEAIAALVAEGHTLID